MLETLITSKTRIKLLLKFFSNANTEGYLRSLADEFQESTNSVRVELNRLSDAGLLESKHSGNTILYRANKFHPLFPEITQIVSKYLGIDRIAEEVIYKLGDLRNAWIIGDYAQGKDSGIIDLVLVGDIDKVYLGVLVEKAEKLVKRRLRLIVLREEELPEFNAKLELKDGIMIYNYYDFSEKIGKK